MWIPRNEECIYVTRLQMCPPAGVFRTGCWKLAGPVSWFLPGKKCIPCHIRHRPLCVRLVVVAGWIYSWIDPFSLIYYNLNSTWAITVYSFIHHVCPLGLKLFAFVEAFCRFPVLMQNEGIFIVISRYRHGFCNHIAKTCRLSYI